MSKNSKNFIFIFMAALLLFGSMMICSAELGNHTGDSNGMVTVILKQLAIVAVSFAGYGFTYILKISERKLTVYWVVYFLILILLFIPFFFDPTNDAYAWIPIGNFFTFQPSELAKIYSILFGSKILSYGAKKKERKYYYEYIVMMLVYFTVILFQNDFGTAIILFGISYCMLMISTSNEYNTGKLHNILVGILIGVIVIVSVLMIPSVNEYLMDHVSDYRIGRITAAYNPFEDKYSTGYNLMLSLTSMATGGWLGVGLGESIHKFMGFPNPSTDFILAIIIEETGMWGFAIICICTIGIMVVLAGSAFKTKILRQKLIYLGTFIYFFLHFALNVGGVSALLPLTGVPLLLVSSGGTSTIMTVAIIGFNIQELRKIKE